MIEAFNVWLTHPGPTLLWTALGFLFGALISHYLTVGWDRTKELNAATAPVRSQLRKELADLRANARWVDGDALNHLVDMQRSYICRVRVSRAVKSYEAARNQYVDRDSYGGMFYTRTDHVEKAITHLLEVFKHR